jgi:predicted transcriptional regulator
MCDGSLKEVAKKAGVTYNYASSLVSRWVAVGILEVRKAGRSFEYRYTAKGLKLRDMFLEYHEAGGKYG